MNRTTSTEDMETTRNYEDSIEETERLAVLPPSDGGKQAWIVLASCSIIQAPTWGYPVSFGVIQQYLIEHPYELSGASDSVAIIGTTLSGVMYLSSPILFATLTRWPKLRRWVFHVGLTLEVLGFLASSFAKELWQLILLQGVIVGLGSNLLLSAATLDLDEWWLRRKGLAYGIMLSAKSLVGAAMPLIFNASLEKYGFRPVVHSWTIFVLVFSIPTAFLTRPRLPFSQVSHSRPLSWTFLRLPSFWLLQTGNFVQSIGYIMPQTYLPSYASTLHLSSLTGTLMLALFSGCSIFGSFILGFFVDRLQVSTCVLVSSVGSVISIFIFWGLSNQVALLAIFAITYGFFAGAYSSTWSGVLKEMKRIDRSVETGLMYGLLSGGRGLGFVLSGPLSSALLNTPWPEGKSWGYGTKYGPMILFSGISALLGGWGFCQRWLRRCEPR